MGNIQRRVSYVQGSIHDVAESKPGGIAEAIVDAEVVVVVDVSGSMYEYDNTSKARYERAQEVLNDLQGQYAGKIILVSFSNEAQFHFTGWLPEPGGGTDLAAALRFVRDLSETFQIILITDGEPNSEEYALREAKMLHSPIMTMFVGEESNGHARDFLKRLSEATGGKFMTTKPELIGEGIKGYLT